MKIAQSLMNTGIVYKRQGLYDKATDCLLEAATYFEENNRLEQLASCFNAIANIQTSLEYFGDALKYHFKALDIREKIGDKEKIASSLNNIGSLYKSMDSLNLALGYYNKALAIKSELNDKALTASTLANIGEIHFLKNNYQDAESHFLESYNLRKEINDKNGILSISNDIAKLYLETGETGKVKNFLDTGYQIARAIQSNDLALTNLRLRADFFEKTKNLPAAIQSLIAYDSLKTVILNGEKIRALTELRIQYETEKNEAEIKNLQEISGAQEARLKLKTRTQYALWLGLSMFLLLTLIVYRAYREKKKSNEKIKTLMQERQHRAKNNLQIITELLGLQSAGLQHEQAKGAIKSGENRMQAVSLIDKMLYQNPENTEINMQEYTQKLVDNLVFVFGHGNRGVNVGLNIGQFSLDASKVTPLGLILNELVTNSFKYAFTANPEPALKIDLKKNGNGEITLCYADNGPGLNEPDPAAKTGSLGIKLIHSLSRQLKGTLTTENRNGLFYQLVFPA